MKTAIGEKYKDDVCKKCQSNIQKQMSKLTAKDYLRPKRIAKKSVKWICDACKKRISNKLSK